MRKDEALEAVEKFLDNALINKIYSLRIIHGIGNGILRKAIQERLRQLTFVNKVQNEDAESGGEGVTIVEIG